ncbi:MAG TPA: four helix bundle protein [Ferruginibacter sp.]|nr:four helix bundle protein [Ferruginibacter sp.]HRE64053.1 four helix bundle protein [Ferruginibacter sp.]
MPFKFENLNIWKKALELTIEINDVAKLFPKHELYSLSSQIRRASDSVVLNIAEGCTGQSNREFNRFLGFSMRSGIEVVSCLYIAKRKKYIDEINFAKYYNEYELLCKMINALRSNLKQTFTNNKNSV